MKLKLIMIVSDDPVNAEIMIKYNAMYFILLIKENRGSSEKFYPTSDIWNTMWVGNQDKLVNFIRTTLTKTLEGKSS